MSGLAERKLRLMADSEANRVHLRADLERLRDQAGGVVAGIGSLGSIAASAATLVAGLTAAERTGWPAPASPRPWWESLLGNADLIASNGDLVHSYGLIAGSAYAARQVRALKRKTFSPSLFVVHFGLNGTFPNVAHHSILFSDRYGPLLNDIYKNGTLAEDPSLYLHHPSATDSGMAPAGRMVGGFGARPSRWASMAMICAGGR